MRAWRRWLVAAMGALLAVTMGLLLVATTSPIPWFDTPWPEAAAKTGIFAGYYRSGWETSDFRAVGTSERWWLSPGAGAQLFPRTCSMAAPCFLVVRGNLSALGQHGHLGYSDRTLDVTAIIEQRHLSLYERLVAFKGL